MLFGAAGCALVGFSLAIGLAGDAHDVGAVHEAVDEGEHCGSVGEGAVGGDQGAVALVAAADEFEQQVGVAVA